MDESILLLDSGTSILIGRFDNDRVLLSMSAAGFNCSSTLSRYEAVEIRDALGRIIDEIKDEADGSISVLPGADDLDPPEEDYSWL